MPVGTFSSTMSLSPIFSRCFTRARSELPWATTSTVSPARSWGTTASVHQGSTRATTSFKHSEEGSAPGSSRR